MGAERRSIVSGSKEQAEAGPTRAEQSRKFLGSATRPLPVVRPSIALEAGCWKALNCFPPRSAPAPEAWWLLMSGRSSGSWSSGPAPPVTEFSVRQNLCSPHWHLVLVAWEYSCPGLQTIWSSLLDDPLLPVLWAVRHFLM